MPDKKSSYEEHTQPQQNNNFLTTLCRHTLPDKSLVRIVCY